MSLSDYLVGAVFFLATMAAVGGSSWLVVHRLLPQLRGAPRLLATATVWTGGVVVVHVVPAAFSVLSRETVLVVAAAALVGTSRLGGRSAEPVPAPAPGAPSGRLSWALACSAVAIFGVYVGTFLYERALVAVSSQDFTFFHLPGVAEWIRSGTLWRVVDFLPNFSTGTYPNNGDVVYLATVLPWKNDAFVRLLAYPFLALTAVAVYAIARELRAPRASAVLFGIAAIAIRVVVVPAMDQLKPEVIMLATFGVGVLFLLRHFRTRERSELAMAGVALGVAFGARWNGMLAVGLAIAAYGIGWWLARREPRAVLGQLGMLVGLSVAGAGIWLARNLLVTGNPVLPFKVAVFGVTVFDAPADPVRRQFGFSVLDYLGSSRVRDEVLAPAYGYAFGAPGLVLAATVVLAAATAGIAYRRRLVTGEEAGSILAIAVVAVAIIVVYASTALSAVGYRGKPLAPFVIDASRWAMPAAVLAAPLAAWLAGRLGRWRHALEIAAFAAIVHATYRQASSFGIDGQSILIVVGAAGAACGLLLWGRRRTWRPGQDRRVLGMAGTAAALASLLIAGQLLQTGFNERRYRGFDATLDWVAAHAPAGHRIAVSGDWNDVGVDPVTPLFGPRLGNEVAYLGPHEHGVLRRFRSSTRFASAVRRGRYDLVLVGRGSRSVAPPELYGAVQARFAPLVISPAFVLYRVNPPATGPVAVPPPPP